MKKKRIRYTHEIVESRLLELGLFLKEKFVKASEKMLCEDKDGYKYAVVFNDVVQSKTPSRFYKSNPHTIYNINLHMKLNGSESRLISDKYENCTIRMEWLCECGEFYTATWNQAISGKIYCGSCSIRKRWDSQSTNYYDDVLNRCREMDYELYTTSITRQNEVIEYSCRKHPEAGIKQTDYSRFVVRKQGCFECGADASGVARRLEEDALVKCVESAGYIYAGFDYDNKDSIRKKVNVHFICPDHYDKGIQKTKHETLFKHQSGCAYCSCSYFERDVANLLDKWGYKYKMQHGFDDCRSIAKLRFDFYLEEYNTLIEADGEGHYFPVVFGSMTMEEAEESFQLMKHRDSIKDNYCKDNRINLIRIPYWERENLEHYLFDKFAKTRVITEFKSGTSLNAA